MENTETTPDTNTEFVWEYSVSTQTLWASFDYGEVTAKTYEEALKLAKAKLKYDFDKVNKVLESADVTQGFSIDYNENDIQLIQQEL